ncbi:hypothetical protein CYMTET_32380 [Cymbomonas tetramitiformis]|uniref:Uncharacterized protein n=1 Tax=Cymbomonas tetramitiformis TaxID=36881 RepID=A0AAE0FF56_9CHLO|nr:hypothetical protein CYMTET_32380 [Cymbomonas tetramitiformis]
MGIIKTALRNSMYPDTLSALMMCSINGPELKEKAAVHALVLRAYKKWEAVKARTPSRSSSASRKKTTWRGKNLTKQHRAPIDILSGADDGEIERMVVDGASACTLPAEEEEGVDAPADVDANLELSWCLLDFTPPEGWLVVPDAPLHVTHKVLKKAAKIAHRFADKWYIGKFRYISQTGCEKGLKVVYYSDDGLLYFHNLAIEEYGTKGKWVILKKEPKQEE